MNHDETINLHFMGTMLWNDEGRSKFSDRRYHEMLFVSPIKLISLCISLLNSTVKSKIDLDAQASGALSDWLLLCLVRAQCLVTGDG